MVIAHVLSSFRVGGQERVAFDLGVGQRDRGHRVLAISLAAPPDGPLAGELHRAGIATHTLPKRGPSIDPTLPLRLAALLRREGVEVVHTHNPQPLIYAAPAARLAGAAVVQTRHGVAFRNGRQAWLNRQAARLADACVVVSRELAEALPPGALGERALSVVENGVDLERLRPDGADRDAVRRDWGLASGDRIIGTVSRLIESKNLPGLLRACAPLLDERTHLVVVGDGPERGRVESVAAGMPRVRLLGVRADVPRLLRGFDVFVLFSRSEGHPIAVLEAMATALPVVATRVGGVPAVLEEGVTGLMVPVDDEAALRAAVTRLLASPEARAELGARGRQVAIARYSRDRMVNDYLALYQQCRRGGAVCSP